VVLTVEPASAGARLDRWLSERLTELSRARLQALIRGGLVRVDGSVLKTAHRLRGGERVEIEVPPAPEETLVPEAVPLIIVYEDDHVLVVDKPAGMVVHPGAGRSGGTLAAAVLSHAPTTAGVGGPRRPGIVHRLDKDTSGLLVVAKDDATMNALGAAFKAHAVERVYEAFVVGKPPGPGGRIDTLYGRDPRERKKFSSRVRTGKRAVTNWKVVERWAGAARVEARLETGRTHQVRVHLAALGCALLGDRTYGRAPKDPALRPIAEELGRQALHARALGFVHPATGEAMSFSSELPADMRAALAALRAVGGGKGAP